jgi:hypothetical protein
MAGIMSSVQAMEVVYSKYYITEQAKKRVKVIKATANPPPMLIPASPVDVGIAHDELTKEVGQLSLSSPPVPVTVIPEETVPAPVMPASPLPNVQETPDPVHVMQVESVTPVPAPVKPLEVPLPTPDKPLEAPLPVPALNNAPAPAPVVPDAPIPDVDMDETSQDLPMVPIPETSNNDSDMFNAFLKESDLASTEGDLMEAPVITSVPIKQSSLNVDPMMVWKAHRISLVRKPDEPFDQWMERSIQFKKHFGTHFKLDMNGMSKNALESMQLHQIPMIRNDF